MKTGLLAAALALSVWSAPAWALPFHRGHTRMEHHDSHSAKRAHLPIRSHAPHDASKLLQIDATSGGGTEEPQGSIISYGSAPVSVPFAPAVPEPSALLLFGVGCLIARRAGGRS